MHITSTQNGKAKSIIHFSVLEHILTEFLFPYFRSSCIFLKNSDCCHILTQ